MFTDASAGRSATDVHDVLVGDTTVGPFGPGPLGSARLDSDLLDSLQGTPVTTTSVTVIVETPASRTGTAGADVVVFTVDDGHPVTFDLRSTSTL